MRVLVTGGAGFIGSHVADALLERGHEVFVLDDLSRGWKENVPPKARLFVADVRSPESKRAIEDIQPDAIFHHAAQMDVRVSVTDPVLDADINVTGTVRLLAAAAKAGASLFVLASTGGAIYGEQDTFPAAEDHPVRSDSPYGISKRCGELYLDYFSRKHNLRTVCLRYANVYGPRQDPHGEAGVVAIFSEKMLRSEVPVIFGDGEQTRDYVYVADVVRANMLALETAAAFGPYNIGTGIETSVNVLAREIATQATYSGEIAHAEGKPGEQRRSVLDTSRASRELGWQPTYSLADGLKKTVGWFRERVTR